MQLGLRALPNLLRKFLARGSRKLNLIIYNGLGQRHSLGRLWKWEGSTACTMCVAAAVAKALGIEAKIPRWHVRRMCASGIAAYSPCRRQCPNTNNLPRTKNQVAPTKLWEASFINQIANFTNWDGSFTNHLAKTKNWVARIIFWGARTTNWVARIILWEANFTNVPALN